MRNYLGTGNDVPYTNDTGSAIAYGAIVVLGHSLGVAMSNIANGAEGFVRIAGVFADAPKVSGAVFGQGEKLIWDVSASAFDDSSATPAAGDITGGAIAAAAGADGETTCSVILTPGNTDVADVEPWDLTIVGTNYFDGRSTSDDPAPGGHLILSFSDSQTSDSGDFAYNATYYAYGNLVTLADAGGSITIDPATDTALVKDITFGLGNIQSGINQIEGPLFDPSPYEALENFTQHGLISTPFPATFDGWPATLKIIDVSYGASGNGNFTGTIPPLTSAPFAASLDYFSATNQDLVGPISDLDIPSTLGAFWCYGNPNMTGDIPRCTYARNTPPAGGFGQFYLGFYGNDLTESGFDPGPCDDLSGVTGTDVLAYSCSRTNRTGVLHIANSVTSALAYSAANNPGITGVTGIGENLQELHVEGCTFDAAAVNSMLAQLVANPFSGNETDRKIYALGDDMAAPTGQGIDDLATLIGRGNTIEVAA